MQVYTILVEGQETRTISLDQHADGTLWQGKSPLLNGAEIEALGIDKKRLSDDIRRGMLSIIPASCYMRLGSNPHGRTVILYSEHAANQAAALEAACPGVAALSKAREAEDAAYEAMRRAIERGDGRMPAPYTGPKSADLAAQYPRAAAYLNAEGYESASHFAKSAAGKKAKTRLLAGEDHQIVVSEMDAEWLAAAEQSVWNA